MLSHDPQDPYPANLVAIDEPQADSDLAVAFSGESGCRQIGLDESEKLVIAYRGLRASFPICNRLSAPGFLTVSNRMSVPSPGVADAFDAIEFAG